LVDKRESFLVLFLKKELLAFTLRESASTPIGTISKSFCFFFQKEALSCLLRVNLNAAWC
jgi:hypothetical protein